MSISSLKKDELEWWHTDPHDLMQAVRGQLLRHLDKYKSHINIDYSTTSDDASFELRFKLVNSRLTL